MTQNYACTCHPTDRAMASWPMRFVCMRRFAFHECLARNHKWRVAIYTFLIVLGAGLMLGSLSGCQLGSAPQGIVICLSCGDVDLDVGIRKPILTRDDRPEVNPLVLP